MNLSQKTTKNIKSFLPYRIFFIILLFTTLPIFIYGVFLYITEYSQKKEEIFQVNSNFGDQIKKNISLDLDLKKQILDEVSNQIRYKNFEVDKYFRDVAKQYNLHALIYAILGDERLIVENSSNSALIKKNITPLKNILKTKNLLFRNNLLLCPKCIYFSKTIYVDGNPGAVLILGFLQKDVFNFSKEELPQNVNISIVDSNGNVIVSTNKSLKYINIKNNNENLIVQDNISGTSYKLITSVNNKYIHALHFKSYFLKHGLIFTIIFVFLFILTFVMVQLLSKPINELLNAMHSIKLGHLERRYKEHKMGFEINYIGSIFNEMMDSLLIQQKQIENEKIEKLKYYQELNIAQEIQLSLLPDEALSIKDVDIAFGNIYAKEVGGDFYDFIERNGKVFFVIADIASKGILACLYALTLRSIIRSYATTSLDLEKIIQNTNHLFIKDAEKNSMFATAFFGLFDVNTKKLEYCNCGHMSAILRKIDGTLDFLTTSGKALGIEAFEKLEIKHTTLKKEDLLFLYTDGIIDAIDVKNKFFGERNLHQFIKKTHGLKSKEVVKNLFDSLKIYSKDTSQYDDATIVVFRII